jgi:hypothetical protein
MCQPAPTIGESPTGSARLLVIPPVEVAAARLPLFPSAIAPTLPNSKSLKRFESGTANPKYLYAAEYSVLLDNNTKGGTRTLS